MSRNSRRLARAKAGAYMAAVVASSWASAFLIVLSTTSA